MLIYTLRRLLAAIPVLLAATIFSFLLVDLSGDPLQNLRLAVPPTPPETIAAEEARLYLDRSTPERYWIWLTGWGDTNDDVGLMQGEWGPSRSGRSIGAELGDRVVNTLRLVTVATILAFALAIVTGVISAVRQYSKTDHTLTFLGFLGLAMPIFWLAALIKESGVKVNDVIEPLIGARPLKTFGATSSGYQHMNFWEQLGDVSGHLVLPTLALMLNGYAVVSRYQRTSMLEVLNSDYVRLARAKGLRNRVVMRRHALRTALIPVVTLAGLVVYGLFTGAVITETIFQWRGMGRFLVDSIRNVDAFATMAILVVTGFILVAANLLADLMYAVLDPRIRYE